MVYNKEVNPHFQDELKKVLDKIYDNSSNVSYKTLGYLKNISNKRTIMK